MTRKLLFVATFFLTALSVSSPSQSPPATNATSPTSNSQESKSAETKPAEAGSLEARVEKYLRNLYAWNSDFDVKIGAPKPSPIADLLEVPVTVSKGGQSDSAVVYVSKSGQYMVRGELTDITVDPFADVAAKLHAGNAPSMGPADAKVTLIEFADFECPSCRQLDLVLRELLPKHPEVRLVFKQFPLTEIHPWAMTAALATQCVYQQDPAAFWKMHDAVFDAQDTITPENAWDKLLELATKSGVNPDTYKACIANPETATQVKSTIDEGHALNITATPTTFVNNRRVVGPDKAMLEQDIAFNLTINVT
ncbi:MAG TPA: thioredoxin domain-containing protein [Bryobacteraceae bacterium]|nr:thioredoxin domain-containing protein [Bryobacteraceae bacterium]